MYGLDIWAIRLRTDGFEVCQVGSWVKPGRCAIIRWCRDCDLDERRGCVQDGSGSFNCWRQLLINRNVQLARNVIEEWTELRCQAQWHTNHHHHSGDVPSVELSFVFFTSFCMQGQEYPTPAGYFASWVVVIHLQLQLLGYALILQNLLALMDISVMCSKCRSLVTSSNGMIFYDVRTFSAIYSHGCLQNLCSFRIQGGINPDQKQLWIRYAIGFILNTVLTAVRYFNYTFFILLVVCCFFLSWVAIVCRCTSSMISHGELSSGSVEPPVMQRRSSLRPHNKVPSAVKNEAHPLIKSPEAYHRNHHLSSTEASYHYTPIFLNWPKGK